MKNFIEKLGQRIMNYSYIPRELKFSELEAAIEIYPERIEKEKSKLKKLGIDQKERMSIEAHINSLERFLDEFKESMRLVNLLLKSEKELSSYSYQQKIEFWKNNDLRNFYFIVHPQESQEPKLEFSIIPQKKQEFSEFANYLIAILKKDHPNEFDIEIIKDSIRETIGRSPLPLHYLERKRDYLKELESRYLSFTSENPFQLGYISIIESKPIDFSIPKNQKWSPSIREVLRGQVTAQLTPFIDKLIIELRENQTKNELNEDEGQPPIIIKQENQKVMILYELGIFELLDSKNELKGNSKKISRLIEAITEINSETIRKTYEAIKVREEGSARDNKNDPYKNKKNITSINGILNNFGLKSRWSDKV